MSKFVGFVIGAALIVAGIVIPGAQMLIIQGAAMIVSNAALLLTMPKAPARQASEMTIQLGEQPRGALFGECFTAGSLVDAFNMGGKYGTKWEFLVIRLADHACDSLTGFYVNDEFYEYAGDGEVPEFGADSGKTSDLEIFFRSDTTNQALRESVYDYGPGWVEADTGESGCDVVVAYRADDSEEKNPEWPAGRPRFGFVVKGKKCYDPRLDSTVTGGSGTHRWDDPSTWEWSDNPAVCRYNWVRGIYANDQVSDPTQLLVGRGLTEDEAPPENIFAAANLCDELVDGEKRYRVSGPIYASQPHLEVEEMFAAATGGSVVTREGSVELEPGASKSVVATFTDDDLVSGSQVSWNQGILSEASGEWVNTVVARYVEPDQHWRDHAAPVRRSIGDILSDGKPRETSITLRLVRWVAQAQRVAEITRRLGRLWGRAQVTLGPRFCELEDGDWVTWTSDRRFGGATKTFRVEAYSIDAKWHNQLTLREINSTAFGDAVMDEDQSVTTPTTPPPEVGEPDADSWVLSAEMLTSSGASIPALVITGACEDDSAGAIIFEYWQDDGVIDPVTNPDDPTWIPYGTLPRTTTRVEITSITGGADYYAAVTYVVDGSPGDRLVLGPETAGEVDVSGQVNPIVTAAIAGLAWKQPVRAKTTAALAANTYSNGVSGLGATLTGTSNGALAAQDGVTLVADDRLLVANEASGSRNGIYAVVQVGDASNPYILMRATDADEPAHLVNATVKVSEGTVYADQEWQCTTNAAITIGTTALVWEAAGGGVEEAPSDGTGYVRKNAAWVAESGGGGGGGFEASPTTPVVADFTLENAGTASMADGTFGIKLTMPSSTTNIRFIRYNAGTPGSSWTIIMRGSMLTPYAIGSIHHNSILLRNTANGRLINFAHTGAQIVIQRWSSYTAFSATIANPSANYGTYTGWKKVTSDGTTLRFYTSSNGSDWGDVIASEALATYIGAVDQIGMGSVNGAASSVTNTDLFESFDIF